MPAFAPLLRPVFVCAPIGLPIPITAAALRVPDGGEDVEATVVVGAEVDADTDVDVAAATIDVDHVVAERSDLR